MSKGVLRALKWARYSNSESSPDPDLGFNRDTTGTDVMPEIEVLPKLPLVLYSGVSFSGWRQKVPCTLKDYISYSLVGLPSHLRPAPPKPIPPAKLEVLILASISDPEPEADTKFTTEPNGFRLYQQYTRKPQTNPEDILTLATKHMEFLWVHWFGHDLDHEGSFETCCLHHIGLTDSKDPTSYEFLNPSDILRSVHLIPTFLPNEENQEADDSDNNAIPQSYYYVSIYVILELTFNSRH